MQKQQEEELLKAFRSLGQKSRDYILFHIKCEAERESANKPKLRLIIGDRQAGSMDSLHVTRRI